MGGCATKAVTKPKDSDIRQELLPAEDSAVTTKAEGETVAQENNNEGEGQIEPSLVELSKEEAGNPPSEPNTVEAASAAVSVEAGEETAKKTEDKVEALVSESKDKAVESGDETPVPAKEGKVEAKEGKDEAKEGKDEAIADKSDVAPLSDNKIDAPLVTA